MYFHCVATENANCKDLLLLFFRLFALKEQTICQITLFDTFQTH